MMVVFTPDAFILRRIFSTGTWVKSEKIMEFAPFSFTPCPEKKKTNVSSEFRLFVTASKYWKKSTALTSSIGSTE